MVSLSLYLLHHIHLYSPSAFPFNSHCSSCFFTGTLNWTSPGLWKPIVCCHWQPCYLVPLPLLPFFWNLLGCFLLFNPCFQMQPRYFSPSSHPCTLLQPLLPAWPPPSCQPLSAHQRGFLSFAHNYLAIGQTLGYVTFSWQLHSIPGLGEIWSCSLKGCSSGMATLCFLALPCFMCSLQDPPLLSPTWDEQD